MMPAQLRCADLACDCRLRSERRNGEKLSTKYQQPQMTVWVLFFIENRLQTERIAQFLPVKL
jgi:hypothetical protein